MTDGDERAPRDDGPPPPPAPARPWGQAAGPPPAPPQPGPLPAPPRPGPPGPPEPGAPPTGPLLPSAPPVWQPPPAYPPGGPGYAGMPAPYYARRWYSLRGLLTALAILLWITAGFALVTAVAHVNERSKFEDAFGGDSIFLDYSEAQDAEDLADGVQGITMFLSLAVAVLLIVWAYRAAKNVEALGRPGATWGPGWAIGSWFIPLANLVLPLLVFIELWRGSDERVPPGDPGWKRASVGGILGAWWAGWVAASVAAIVMFGAQPTEDEFFGMNDFRFENSVSIAWAVVYALAAVLLVQVVRTLTRRFDAAGTAQWGSPAA